MWPVDPVEGSIAVGEDPAAGPHQQGPPLGLAAMPTTLVEEMSSVSGGRPNLVAHGGGTGVSNATPSAKIHNLDRAPD
jgi:hypothetical protein